MAIRPSLSELTWAAPRASKMGGADNNGPPSKNPPAGFLRARSSATKPFVPVLVQLQIIAHPQAARSLRRHGGRARSRLAPSHHQTRGRFLMSLKGQFRMSLDRHGQADR